jgi:hypothetical protein
MEFIRWLFTHALNPGSTLRLWRVDCGGWHSGRFENFWMKRNAIKYAEKQPDLFVSVHNNWTNESIRFREPSKDRLFEVYRF